jgi:hypothetical protein
VEGSEDRRYNCSWKLAASLLGLVALVAASATVSLLDLDAPWGLIVYFGVMAIVLLGGTMWLVPGSRVKQAQRTTGTTDTRH